MTGSLASTSTNPRPETAGQAARRVLEPDTLRRECLDHQLITGPERVTSPPCGARVRRYTNPTARTDRSTSGRAPASLSHVRRLTGPSCRSGRCDGIRLGGLVHQYVQVGKSHRHPQGFWLRMLMIVVVRGLDGTAVSLHTASTPRETRLARPGLRMCPPARVGRRRPAHRDRFDVDGERQNEAQRDEEGAGSLSWA
jgi:hypothetical protein